ncbi:C-C motif chemokine 4-like [Fundulus heteroclitus]|uniref:C-C motif chemokine 4-like n=1 Tax=Fundulus heteroclitus TaxID=8078 RepID=UPI00165CDC1D|nr:C-C motif chemokine 4-like [Fundulus heteroclitus]
MKTLCLSLGLLLVVACCCDAIPEALQYSTSPVKCCNVFSNTRVPRNKVSSIKKTHNSCMKKGFIVETIKGKLICFDQSFGWAKNLYKQIRNAEGNRLQQ